MTYRAKGIRTLGIMQMAFGVLMGVFGIASLGAVHHWSSYVACGLWVGVWVFLTGMFGYLGAKSDTTPNNCLIGVMMGFAITGCVMTPIMLIIYSISVAQFSERVRCSRSYVNCYHPHYFDYLDKAHAEAGLALGSLLLILSIVEFFTALASSIYGCNACCCAPTPSQPPAQIAYIGPQHGNVVVIPAGGFYAGSAVQTVTYPGQAAPMTVYQQQQYTVPQGQVYNQPPNQGTAQVPPAPNYQAFQAQGGVPDHEKPPPYNAGQ